MFKEKVAAYFKELQDAICKSLEKADGSGTFIEDVWTREEGGGGRTRVINKGNVIEKGGVAFSAVHGPTPDNILAALRLEKSDFFATGVSLVIHPENPFVPIVHMNVRYFEMSNGVNWFGGGIDLTPHYIYKEDAVFFHQKLKELCDMHAPHYYPEFKAWADDYFYLKHRKETRGIGGIFFDRLSSTDSISIEQRFRFVQNVGEVFAPLYTYLMLKNKDMAYGEKEKQWQRLRRGRYVEFNLLWDKGTKFGLDTDGRTESILMSLPPLAQWEYNYKPEQGSKEEETLLLLRKGINWV